MKISLKSHFWDPRVRKNVIEHFLTKKQNKIEKNMRLTDG